MGLSRYDSQFLFHSKRLGVSFSESLMLGRLNLYTSKEEIASCIKKYNNNVKNLDEVVFRDEYSEPLFEILGALRTDSIDFSDYEKASIIHDLNFPVPARYKNKYTAVVDGGTIEHIFNFPVAIKNCMEMLSVGGHYIGITPTNNLMGHGFYQFSPELFYRVFSKENGFRMKQMLICVPAENTEHWYEVADPKRVGERVGITNNFPVSLMFVAEKITDTEIFKQTPQQSDYTHAWDVHVSVSANKVSDNEGKLKHIYRKVFPKRLRTIFRNVYDLFTVQKESDQIIGDFNATHFRKIDI